VKLRQYKKESGEVLGYMFVCPGCGNYHTPKTLNDGNGFTWEFNGSLTAPTLAPSLLFTEQGQTCHSFVRNGTIYFCEDSTHCLAGQTVELFDI
jgi:hypothetical protein